MGLVFLIDRPGLHVAAESHVVKRDDAFIVGDLADALDAAHRQAAAIVAAAEQAYRERREQGYRDGIAQARQELAEQTAAVIAARAVALQSLVPLLADLAMDALALLLEGVGREAFFARAIAAVQRSLRAARFARMRVASAQLGEAQAALAALGEATGLGALLTVVADDALALDACVFESDLGTADASLAKQLDAIRASLHAAVRSVAYQASLHRRPTASMSASASDVSADFARPRSDERCSLATLCRPSSVLPDGCGTAEDACQMQ